MYCTGHSDNKQFKLAEVDEPTNAESTPLTNEIGAGCEYMEVIHLNCG